MTLGYPVWNNLLPKLEEQLALEQDRRTQEAFDERVDDRLDLIVLWYDEYVGENLSEAERSLMPNLCDARELPSLLALAQSNNTQSELSHEAFLALTDQVLADAEEYKMRAKRELANTLCRNSVCRALELADVPPEDALQRYCAYFKCVWECNSTVDGCRYLTYEQLHAHWHEVHPENRWLHGDADDVWNRVRVPTFWPDQDLSGPSIGRRAGGRRDPA